MTAFYRLDRVLQRYDWGSTTALQQLLGLPVDGEPLAELWMGAHPQHPSHVAGGAPLDALLRERAQDAVGRRVLETYGPRLPYLLKLLAAERALSLQVHPQPHRARAGFNRENRDGVAPGAPERSFRDDQHKPEMVVALTRFEGLSGFRRPRRTLQLLDGLPGDLVGRMREALRARPTSAGVRDAFTLAVHARDEPGLAADLAVTVAAVAERRAAGGPSRRADAAVAQLDAQHPGDPGVVASLMLNRVTLEPGESFFVPAGHVHAYLSGCAVEIMASSDNVLRAGLTSKHVDVASLLECATFVPGPAARPETHRTGGLVELRAPVREFALVVGRPGAERVALPGDGPRVAVVVEGEVELDADGDRVTLAPGEPVFVPHAAGRLGARGGGLLVLARVP
ncbi:mannose-6-phosphate isomerase, class I [Cellulomonas sp. PhB143]|uniref:mannose-6-phosphate isomerase, class I n=1 Tax=Cellulomonas sp. PhB143 TaxID=2485186 RepID=UPI000F466FB8|nr:mannose-6-phosphate isomerase, class I [Cellulomonas sp. PhB143]ROS78746.1 mannose-6-phosphate isomerase type 1 [Cellulomonas sp. PhB143]